ncbi:hypothetical protein SAMN05216298_2951 [Glycomyces sambucus]|uniref:Uncharacterized protein n=1 Tax=Glycomyces sambucus TaxID=380244 RepID=A0A1G9I064_9ACTN|nr:hypothetical protein [Glycomyces sambucus]SDL18609.1 hypothetical protein SAMN05216298_2951 [Glycomyces sambucus]
MSLNSVLKDSVFKGSVLEGSVFKSGVRRVSATLVGLVMAGSLAGVAVAGSASAAPDADPASPVTGEYTAQVQWFYESYFARRVTCVTKGEIYEDEGYLYQCRTAERNNRVVYELWLGIG